MVRQDIYSDDGYLSALVTGAYAVDTVAQDVGDSDFSVLSIISTVWNLKNVSVLGGSSANSLVSNEIVEDGDLLIIVLDDDSTVDVVASGVSGSGPYLMDTTAITSGETPSRVYKDNVTHSYNDTDPVLDTESLSIGDGIEIGVNAGFHYNIDGWTQDGSTDMTIIWLQGRISIGHTGVDSVHKFNDITTEIGRSYRVKVSDLVIDDVSSVVRAYNGNGTLIYETTGEGDFSQDVVALSDTIYFEVYIPSGAINIDGLRVKEDSLQVDRTFLDVLVFGRTIDTRFNLGAKGNEVLSHKAGAFKENV